MAKILVVDDDPAVREILTLNLKGKGHEVTAVSDGAQGVEAARRERPDVVFLDCEMPTLAGEGAFEKFRAHPAMAEIPVIFLSSLPLSRQVGRVPVSRDVRFLRKPVNGGELFAVLAEVLAGRGSH